MATVSWVRRPWHTRRISPASSLCMSAQVVQLATTAAVESTSVPSISTSSPWARNNITSRYRSNAIDAVRLLRARAS
jgi:hypothetical protein